MQSGEQSERTRSSSGGRRRNADSSPGDRLILCPHIALVDGQARDQFCDVRDAVAAARSIHKQSPAFDVVVTDMWTGRLKIEIDQQVGQ